MRAVSAADPADVGYAVVPAHPYIDVTDDAGVSDAVSGTIRILPASP